MTWSATRLIPTCSVILLVALLTACSGLGSLQPPTGDRTVLGSMFQQVPRSQGAEWGGPLQWTARATGGSGAIIEPGTGWSEGVANSAHDEALAAIRVALNFVDTDVREFSRVLFSELLERPYVVDQSVSGVVTVRSGGQVDGNTALALARQALEATGNTIRQSDGVYRVSNAAGMGYDAGGNMRTFPLKHIDADAAQAALGGILQGRAEILSASDQAIALRADTETLALVDSLLQVVDVDRFSSASFGLFPLRGASAREVSQELEALYQGVGVSAQAIIPIERINAVLIIASKPAHLEFAHKWVFRLDQAPTNSRQVYVVQVRNRDATEVATLLQEVFSGRAVGTAELFANEGAGLTDPGSFLGPDLSDSGPRITADAGANSLVIRANPDEYALVERALARLDRPLDQVYVEATIAEVRLSGELSRGVRWFMESGGFSSGISDVSNGAIAASFPGFNFAFSVPQVNLVISALESRTDVRIVSTPQLTVIDRQQATIQVGDQVPIVTRTVQDTSSGSNVIANDVSFRDTGVILNVTPQIRSSGEVVLEIEQEVSRVVPTTSSQINSPTISQRKVQSTVRVTDGTAIVLGGLISSNMEESGGGLPGTQKTLLESIFGSTKTGSARSELIIIIRPVIIRDSSDLRDVVTEIADKMRLVTQVSVD